MVYDPAQVGRTSDSPYRRGMQTASGSMDFDAFTDKVSSMLKAAWGEDWGTFVQSEPTGNDPEKIDLPIITFDTKQRTPSSSHKSPDPVLFDKVKDPDHPTTFLEIYRQWFDMEVNFWVYHQTNRDARILMEAFEDFLFEYKDYFKDLGISDITFKSEEPPQVVTMWGKELPQRNLVYLVRIERVKTRRSNTTQAVNTVVKGQNDSYAGSTKQSSSIVQAYGETLRLEE